MCTIISDYTSDKPVTGYKVAVKRNGKYYSPATSIEYKPGPVEVAAYETHKCAHTGFCRDLLNRESIRYNSKYTGLTAVFKHQYAAWQLSNKLIGVENSIGYEHSDLVILEMKLSNVKYEGTYDVNDGCMNTPVLMGGTIDSISEVKELQS